MNAAPHTDNASQDTPPQRRACSNCVSWVAKADVPRNAQHIPDGFGECRRRAPSGMTFNVGSKDDAKWAFVAMQFPPTADLDWCGDFNDRSAADFPF